MLTEKFKVEIYDLGREYAVETYPEGQISKTEFKKWVYFCVVLLHVFAAKIFVL